MGTPSHRRDLGRELSVIYRYLPARLLAPNRPPRPVATTASQLGTRKQDRTPRYTRSVSVAVQVPEPEMVTLAMPAPVPMLVVGMNHVPLRT